MGLSLCVAVTLLGVWGRIPEGVAQVAFYSSLTLLACLGALLVYAGGSLNRVIGAIALCVLAACVVIPFVMLDTLLLAAALMAAARGFWLAAAHDGQAAG
jgi:predicted membrane protein